MIVSSNEQINVFVCALLCVCVCDSDICEGNFPLVRFERHPKHLMASAAYLRHKKHLLTAELLSAQLTVMCASLCPSLIYYLSSMSIHLFCSHPKCYQLWSAVTSDWLFVLTLSPLAITRLHVRYHRV